MSVRLDASSAASRLGPGRLSPGRRDWADLWRLALPAAIVQVGLMAMGVVDTILVGHVSAADLAAVALGNLYVFGASAFGLGVVFALDPIVAQSVGAGDEPAVSRAIQRGLFLAVILTLGTSAAFLPAGEVFRMLGQPPEVVPLAARYVHLSIPGMFPFFAFMVLRQSLQAMGKMRPVVATILIANVVNALLCWVLVFGRFGVPLRGAAGASVATTLARWALMVTLLAIAWRSLRPLLRARHREILAFAPIARMLRLGVPIGVQVQLEFGVFAVVALLMGRLGMVQVAAHQVAINIASFTFMVPLGISTAAGVLVGQAVGAGDPWRARRAAVAALLAGFAFMALSGATLVAFPSHLARLYSTDLAVAALATALIPIAGVFQVFDGLQVVAIGCLRGIGDTRAPMVVNVLGFWLIGMPVSLWLCFGAGGGAIGLWWGLVVGLAAVAVFLLARVRSRMRRTLERIVIDDGAGILEARAPDVADPSGFAQGVGGRAQGGIPGSTVSSRDARGTPIEPNATSRREP